MIDMSILPPPDQSVHLDLGHFTHWLAAGERGLSSEAIVRHLTGQAVGSGYHRNRPDHPHDPDDFRRCQLLLKNHPLAQMLFPTMKTASPVWARLVGAWDEIHEAIEGECPDYITNPSYRRATKGYHLMKRVIAGGTKCEDCDGIGRGAACEKCDGSGKRAGGKCRAAGCYGGYGFCNACRGRGYFGGDR